MPEQIQIAESSPTLATLSEICYPPIPRQDARSIVLLLGGSSAGLDAGGLHRGALRTSTRAWYAFGLRPRQYDKARNHCDNQVTSGHDDE